MIVGEHWFCLSVIVLLSLLLTVKTVKMVFEIAELCMKDFKKKDWCLIAIIIEWFAGVF